MPIKLVVASHNQNKVKEFQEMLGDDFDLAPLGSDDVEPEETGSTYYENSLIKAEAAALDYPNTYVVADDSGVEIEALDGGPGIYTARYPDENASVQENSVATMASLVLEDNRRATYQCCLVLIDPTGEKFRFDGSIEGELVRDKRGENGFAYDFFFIPDGEKKTFAEFPSDYKNRVSHRGVAVAKMLEHLEAEATSK